MARRWLERGKILALSSRMQGFVLLVETNSGTSRLRRLSSERTGEWYAIQSRTYYHSNGGEIARDTRLARHLDRM